MRGMLGASNQLGITIGILLVYTLGIERLGLGWRHLALLGVFPSGVLLVASFKVLPGGLRPRTPSPPDSVRRLHSHSNAIVRHPPYHAHRELLTCLLSCRTVSASSPPKHLGRGRDLSAHSLGSRESSHSALVVSRRIGPDVLCIRDAELAAPEASSGARSRRLAEDSRHG